MNIRSPITLSLAVSVILSGCGGSDSTAPPDDGIAPVAGCVDGREASSEALYRICFPTTWNGDLVVFAHGYVAPGEPLRIEDAFSGGSISAAVTSLGYAFAATSYRANGLVVPEAVTDLADLVATVRSLYRPDPRRVYVVGVSEGGLIAALAVERQPDVVDGALAVCGPVGDFQRQINYFGDVRVVFDYYFPGLLPGTAIDIPTELRENWTTVYVPRVGTALEENPSRADDVLRVTGAPFDPGDRSRTVETIVGVLWYNVFATDDAQERLGGQPFDNATRAYTGSADDGALNAGVARFAADADATTAIASRFQTTGNIDRPVVTLHTTGDPIVPFAQEADYAARVSAAGAASLLAQLTVMRYGHCTATPDELSAAFGTLVSRVLAR